ncbi:MAG: HPr family phosphocarrier protein [Candidatus Hatepunaea meridiana]|nr:HPr family phosphocarrier protein [Candidatus Hatepunaea meridiana]
MVSKKVKITNELGIHARPATKLVRIASSGKSQVSLIKDNQRANAQSILGVMLLEAISGSSIIIEVEGEDEEMVLEKLVRLINNNFEED